jgi:signal transduction histidine kinase
MTPEGDDDPRERFAMLGQIATEIAHELGNVLQVISGSAYVARQALAHGDPRAALAQVEKLERNARSAQALVDDLMSLARGESIRPEPVLLSGVLAASRLDLPPGSAQWLDALEPSDLRVRAHAGLLATLLRVLYDNAIRASAPRPPRIATRARRSGAGARIEVADDGPGVPRAIAERVFEPLVTGRPGGRGIGLSLARRIAAAHGGAIALVDCEGGGATFCVELPGDDG